MMAAAHMVGRGRAHDPSTGRARRRARRPCPRRSDRRELDPELVATLPPLETLLDPAQYLGETDAIVTTALEALDPRDYSRPAAGWNSSTVIPSGSLRYRA